jgi:hypothetical protein
MRSRLAALLCAALLLSAPSAVPADGEGHAYVAEIEDLPLMSGLAEVPGAGVSFDKPAGRIVEAFAHGAVSRQRVRAFYRDTLPQLGWERASADHYVREGELLEIDYLGADGDLTVRYTLQPR